MTGIQKWSVIFFIDATKPKKVGLLKRSHTKSFAPNFYTGIGGKIGDAEDIKNETPLEGAYRELDEETLGTLSKSNAEIHEFARCVYDNDLVIHYFWLVCKSLPAVDEKDGELVWANIVEMLTYNLIPTTKAVCTEWKKRDFSTDKQFTVYVSEVGFEKTVRLVEVTKVVNELRT